MCSSKHYKLLELGHSMAYNGCIPTLCSQCRSLYGWISKLCGPTCVHSKISQSLVHWLIQNIQHITKQYIFKTSNNELLMAHQSYGVVMTLKYELTGAPTRWPVKQNAILIRFFYTVSMLCCLSLQVTNIILLVPDWVVISWQSIQFLLHEHFKWNHELHMHMF